MIFEEEPENFDPEFDVSSCFVENNEKILLLHRQDYKPEGDTWGVPAGKVDAGEEVLESIVREIREETGYVLPASELSYFKKVFVKYPEYDFVYHIYHAGVERRENVTINYEEHKDFQWLSPENALNLPLIQDLRDCIKLFYDL